MFKKILIVFAVIAVTASALLVWYLRRPAEMAAEDLPRQAVVTLRNICLPGPQVLANATVPLITDFPQAPAELLKKSLNQTATAEETKKSTAYWTMLNRTLDLYYDTILSPHLGSCRESGSSYLGTAPWDDYLLTENNRYNADSLVGTNLVPGAKFIICTQDRLYVPAEILSISPQEIVLKLYLPAKPTLDIRQWPAITTAGAAKNDKTGKTK